MLPRHAVNPARKGIRLIATYDQSTLLFAHIDQIIRVTQAGSAMCKFVTLHCLESNMLVIDRGCWEIESSHGGDARSPHPGRVDDNRSFDRTFLGEHFLNFTFGREFNPCNTRMCINRDA